MIERVEGINPIFGMRITTRYDPLAKGFDEPGLVKTLNSISDTRHDYDMLMESASFAEVDAYYNPGVEEVADDYVLEAIVVDKFSKTERRMAAVVRVLNKHLADSEVNALDAIVGKPKKTGSYAYVTVQLPFSDGQVVSVIFHAPEGDKRQIGPSDQIIAFRWLLNKRDITQVVAPEDGSEISLESLAKRITQLVVKNSARFERTQKEAQAERQELDKAREDLKEAEDRQRELMGTLATVAKDAESIEAKLSSTLTKLEKQKAINAELQARLDAMRKTQPAGGMGGKSAHIPDLTEKRAELEAWKRTLESMLKGETSPQNILGYNGSKKEAKKVAETKIREIEKEIEEIEAVNFTDASVQNEESSPQIDNDPQGWLTRVFKEASGEDTENVSGDRIAKASSLIEKIAAAGTETGLAFTDSTQRFSQFYNSVFGATISELRWKIRQSNSDLEALENGDLKLKSGNSKREYRAALQDEIEKFRNQLDEAITNANERYDKYIEYLEARLANKNGTDETKKDFDEQFGPAYPEFTGKPEQAIEHLLKEKKGYVPGAFYKEGLGSIDLPWGDDAKGLKHILKRRNEQGYDGETFVRQLPEVINNGRVEPDKKHLDRKNIVDDARKVVVSLEWNGDKKTWLLTAFPLYGKNQVNSDQDVAVDRGTADGTEHITPPSSPDITNINMDSQSVNLQFIQDLNDILAGKYDGDLKKLEELLESAMDAADATNEPDKYAQLIDDASNHYSELLIAEAANVNG